MHAYSPSAIIDPIESNPFRQSTSGVTWGAIFAGAAAAAALSLILLILGVGLGLSDVSPFSYNMQALGLSTIAWIAFTQLAASGIGGYLAGRLRVKWVGIHTDEVYFRDTAHGLLTWAVASLGTAALLAGVVRVALGGAVDVGSSVSQTVIPAVSNVTASTSSSNHNQFNYFSNSLLRVTPENLNNVHPDASIRDEVNQILTHAVVEGKLKEEDKIYLVHLLMRQNNLGQTEAEQRVDQVYDALVTSIHQNKETLKQTAQDARKAAAHSALWMFIALLCGAFIASAAATIGGRQRDNVNIHNHS